MTADELQKLLTDGVNSFFRSYLTRVHPLNDRSFGIDSNLNDAPPDISFDINVSTADNETLSEEDSFSFIKKVGRVAFKYSLALKLCKTNQLKYLCELMDLFATEAPSRGVLQYARDIFINPNRAEQYFSSNFNHFSFDVNNISEGCSVYHTCIYSMISSLVTTPFVRDFLFFDSTRKSYLDSFLDGSKSSGTRTIHLLLYYDDFSPLLNGHFSNAQKYKCSCIYLKICNISPIFSSKRSCVIPFMIFFSKDFKANKHKIFKFAQEKINELLNSVVTFDDIDYQLRILGIAADSLAAHELLGLTGCSSSNPCRFCTMSREEMQCIFDATECELRNGDSMKKDYEVFMQVKSKTKVHVRGVKDRPLLNKLDFFDFDPHTYISCISHDLFEKIVPEVITTIIGRMHHDKIVDADSIYQMLQNFPYNSHDKQNPINFLSNLSSFSSSQGRLFCKTFLFVLRNNLPYDNSLFLGFKCLVRVVDYVLSPFFYKSWFKPLEKDIKCLLHFVRYVLNLTIYPKLHFLIHYPMLL